MNTTQNNISDAIKNAFNFSVEKFPLEGPDNLPTDQYGLFASDTGYIKGVQSVSKNYTPHTTEDVTTLAEAAASAFGNDVNVECHWQRGHYVTISPTDGYRRAIYGERDNIFPRLTIRAGYNGQSFRGSIGYYRDACDNLLMIQTVKKFTVSIRHDRNLRSRMSDLIDTFRGLSAKWQSVGEMASEMQRREVSLARFLNDVYGTPTPEQLALHQSGQRVRAVTTHEKRTEAIFRRIVRERTLTGRPDVDESDWRVSAWEAFNAVQGYVQHDATIRRENDTRFDRIIRAANSPAVRKAFTMATSDAISA